MAAPISGESGKGAQTPRLTEIGLEAVGGL
jgi:hypothetical protein